MQSKTAALGLALAGALALSACGGGGIDLPSDAPPDSQESLPVVQQAVEAAASDDLRTLCGLDEEVSDYPEFADACAEGPRAESYPEDFIGFVKGGDVSVSGVTFDGNSNVFVFALENGAGDSCALWVEPPDESHSESAPVLGCAS